MATLNGMFDSALFPNEYRGIERQAGRDGAVRGARFDLPPGEGASAGRGSMACSLILAKERLRQQRMLEYMMSMQSMMKLGGQVYGMTRPGPSTPASSAAYAPGFGGSPTPGRTTLPGIYDPYGMNIPNYGQSY